MEEWLPCDHDVVGSNHRDWSIPIERTCLLHGQKMTWAVLLRKGFTISSLGLICSQ